MVWNNRITLAAIRGQNQTLLSSPVTQASPEIDRPEKARYWEESSRVPLFPSIEGKRSLRSKLGRFLPNALKRLLRKIT